MDKEVFKKFERKRESKIEKIIGSLLDNKSVEEVEADIQWLEASSKLLGHKKNNRRWKLITDVTVVLILLFFAGMLWTMSLSEINVSIKTRSSNVKFMLADKWTLSGPFTVQCLRIENIQTLHAPELNISFEDESRSSSLDITGENIVIEKLELQRDGIVELDSKQLGNNSDCLMLSILHTKIEGTFSVKNISTLTTSGSKDIKIKEKKFEYPEYVEFYSTSKGEVPTNIIFKSNPVSEKRRWQLTNIKTKKIDFLRGSMTIDGTYSFDSSINEGEIKLYDVPVKEKIHKGDMVIMDEVELRRLNISGKDEIDLFLEGKVRNLKVGPRGFEKRLAPSYLEYLYHQERFIFFCSAVGFLWGLLFGIRKIIFNQ